MKWESLLSLKRYGDKTKRLRIEQDENRLGFEVDYDRIIFSSAFRSLQDKTQVIPLSGTDFVHTRLTHSLETSVVARSLGRIVGEKVLEKHPHLAKDIGHKPHDFGAIVAAAALAHDIGNPPFGHSGEKAIGSFFTEGIGKKYEKLLTPKQYRDLTHFEGNANGFRILNQSEPGIDGGLRLSYATLGAFLKYPKESLPHKPTTHVADKKYGVFQTDTNLFLDVASELGLISTGKNGDIGFSRHPLAFLVEAADDICYTIIDFEDGINLGLIPEEYALEMLIKLIGYSIDKDKYAKLNSKRHRVSYLRALAVNTLIQECASTFMANEEAIFDGTFDKPLIDKSNFTAQIDDILKISIENIYQSQEVIEKEVAGYEILHTLLDVQCKSLDNPELHYSKLIQQLFDNFPASNLSLYNRLLNICSNTALLTDSASVSIYQKLKGFQVKRF